MSERIEFVRNYNDLSTIKGFQFEFIYDWCGNFCCTKFNTSSSGMITSVFHYAAGLAEEKI